MNYKQLKYFVAVAEELSFTRAARCSFISQSALSQQIQGLENEIGCKLLIRGSRHVELTAAGESFLHDARLMLVQEKEAIRKANLADSGLRGEFRLGYIKGYENTDLADILFKFHARFPNVRLTLLRENVAELYDALNRNEIDVAINLLYDQEQMNGLQWAILRHYPLNCLLSVAHPLAGRVTLRMEELSGYELIDIKRGLSTYGESEAIEKAFAQAGVKPKVAYISEDVETSLLCVAAGLGYALLPGYITDTLPKSDKVVAVPLEGKEHEMCVVASWASEHMSNSLKSFLTVVKNE